MFKHECNYYNIIIRLRLQEMLAHILTLSLYNMYNKNDQSSLEGIVSVFGTTDDRNSLLA